MKMSHFPTTCQLDYQLWLQTCHTYSLHDFTVICMRSQVNKIFLLFKHNILSSSHSFGTLPLVWCVGCVKIWRFHIRFHRDSEMSVNEPWHHYKRSNCWLLCLSVHTQSTKLNSKLQFRTKYHDNRNQNHNKNKSEWQLESQAHPLQFTVWLRGAHGARVSVGTPNVGACPRWVGGWCLGVSSVTCITVSSWADCSGTRRL